MHDSPLVDLAKLGSCNKKPASAMCRPGQNIVIHNTAKITILQVNNATTEAGWKLCSLNWTRLVRQNVSGLFLQ